jgi:hypothetical protein
MSGVEWLDLQKRKNRPNAYLVTKPLQILVSRILSSPAPVPSAHNADPPKSGAMPCAILILETKYSDGSVESAVSDSQTQTTLKMLGVRAKKLQSSHLQMK